MSKKSRATQTYEKIIADKDKVKVLTPAQWRLYNYLKQCYEQNPEHWVTKDEIALQFPNNYPRSLEWSSPVNSSAYRSIRADIEALRDDDTIMHIVISSSKGYKIATKQEANEYFTALRSKHLKSLRILNKQVKKAKLDGQYRNAQTEFEKSIMEVFTKSSMERKEVNDNVYFK